MFLQPYKIRAHRNAGGPSTDRGNRYSGEMSAMDSSNDRAITNALTSVAFNKAQDRAGVYSLSNVRCINHIGESGLADVLYEYSLAIWSWGIKSQLTWPSSSVRS